MNKYWIRLMLASVLAAFLVACGGDVTVDDVQDAVDQAQEVVEQVATEAGEEIEEAVEAVSEEVQDAMDGEEVVLNAYVGGANDQEYLDWAKAEFESMHSNVTVNFVTAGEVVEDRLGIYLQIFEAQSPELDVAQIDVIWPGDLAEHFIDLNDLGARDVAGDHFPAIVENNTVDGSLVGIPYFTDAGLLYYRTDLLEKYGYDAPPATWDELEEMATTIQDGERADNPDFDGFVWQGRAYEGLTCDALEWIDSHGGGTIVSPDGTITINNDNAIAAIERAAGWVGTISPEGVTDYAEEEARGQWQAGNAAFMRNWPYAYSLGNGDDSPIAGNFAVAALPSGPASDKGSATLGGWQLAVSKYSEQPELAAELALFMASEESQRQNALMTSKIPTIMSLYEDSEVIGTYPWFSDLLPVFTSAAARPSTATAPQYSDTSALFFTAVNSVLTGEQDADEALAELELELEDLLGFPTGAPSGMTAADEMAESEGEMGEEMTLNVYVGGANDQEYLDWAKAEFEGMHPNVTINFVTAGEVVEDRLGIYLQIFEAQSPELDVAQIDVIWPGDLAEHFVDLNEYGASDVTDAHFPAIVENNTVDGSLVGIPYFTDAGLLYYRTDLLEKYGYAAPPATWDELEEMAQAIQDGERADNPDFDGFVWQGRAYEGLTCDALEWIDSHGGGTIVSPEGVITIFNDNAISALERAAGWVGTISPVGVTDYAEEEARGQWQAGNAAFMRNWPYAYSLGNGDDSPIAGNFAVAALPAGPASDKGSATLGGWQLAVSKYSEQPDMAAEFALFLAGEESQRQNALMTSKIPTIMSLYEDSEVIGTYPWFQDLLPVFTSAAARPSTATAPQYSATSALFFNAVNSVLIGEADADEALAELELELQDLLGFEIGSP